MKRRTALVWVLVSGALMLSGHVAAVAVLRLGEARFIPVGGVYVSLLLFAYVGLWAGVLSLGALGLLAARAWFRGHDRVRSRDLLSDRAHGRHGWRARLRPMVLLCLGAALLLLGGGANVGAARRLEDPVWSARCADCDSYALCQAAGEGGTREDLHITVLCARDRLLLVVHVVANAVGATLLWLFLLDVLTRSSFWRASSSPK